MHPDRMISKASLIRDLQRLGLKPGDHVLVRASLSKLGRVEEGQNRASLLIDCLLEVIGPEGLLLGLSFSKPDLIFSVVKQRPYAKEDPVITGGFANEMIARVNHTRSKHPTNSFVAIGKGSDVFLAAHSPKSACFAPIGQLVAHPKGKMLLVGCQVDSPGYSSIHFAQNLLGLDTKTRFFALHSRYYVDENGKRKTYIKKDVPGCSMGFDKHYEHYRRANILHEDKIGEADGWLVSAKEALDIDLKLLTADPAHPLCDRDSCMFCRLGPFYKTFELSRFVRGKLRAKKSGHRV
jgi:aminoglycoside 3-N-acetyltransferase